MSPQTLPSPSRVARRFNHVSFFFLVLQRRILSRTSCFSLFSGCLSIKSKVVGRFGISLPSLAWRESAARDVRAERSRVRQMMTQTQPAALQLGQVGSMPAPAIAAGEAQTELVAFAARGVILARSWCTCRACVSRFSRGVLGVHVLAQGIEFNVAF